MILWTDNDCGRGPSGELYSIWAESHAGRHGDRIYQLMTWRNDKWHILNDTQRRSRRDVKRLAEQIEKRQHPKPSVGTK